MMQWTNEQAFEMAVQHHQAGRLAQADDLYRQVLERRPRHVGALHYRGILALQTGQIDLAVELIQQVTALQPEHAPGHSSLGDALRGGRRWGEAAAAYRRALALQPQSPEVYNNLAIVLREQGDVDQAIACCREAIALRAEFPEAWCNLANALSEKGKMEEAIAAYHRAIALKPQFPEAYSNLGHALCVKGELDEAIAACRQAVALRPDYARAYSNLGNALREKDLSEQAIEAYRRAISLRPDLAEAHSNLANVLWDMGDLDRAIEACQQAIALNPMLAEAHWNLALSLLAQGEWTHGLMEYEWRWKVKDFPSARRDFPQPRWDGSRLDGRTLLLHAEQGFGDVIQMMRYVPLAAQRGGKVVVECQPELKRLLHGNARGWQVIGKGEALPAFDVHCPLLSLPQVFETTPRSIPAQVPCLQAVAESIAHWRQRLGGEALRVGLAWAGNPAVRKDHLRSLRQLSLLAPLAGVKGVQFVSLQKGEAASQTRNPPAGMQIIDWTSELRDFADTAGLLANLDLVISSDTAVAHLAGAMGKPVWVMLPFMADWRWLRGSASSAWYPTMRLFRQAKRGEWGAVVGEVAGALGKWVER